MRNEISQKSIIAGIILVIVAVIVAGIGVYAVGQQRAIPYSQAITDMQNVQQDTSVVAQIHDFNDAVALVNGTSFSLASVYSSQMLGVAGTGNMTLQYMNYIAGQDLITLQNGANSIQGITIGMGFLTGMISGIAIGLIVYGFNTTDGEKATALALGLGIVIFGVTSSLIWVVT